MLSNDMSLALNRPNHAARNLGGFVNSDGAGYALQFVFVDTTATEYSALNLFVDTDTTEYTVDDN